VDRSDFCRWLCSSADTRWCRCLAGWMDR
jgi:hypothetical protein